MVDDCLSLTVSDASHCMASGALGSLWTTSGDPRLEFDTTTQVVQTGIGLNSEQQLKMGMNQLLHTTCAL